jgi:hypothetical protein
MRAGYSGNRPYDSLGLFGMGFNISTGKLGRVTRFLTARKNEHHAIEVVLDLIALQEKHSYKVPVNLVSRPPEFDHGTVVEVYGWWPDGNPNSGFIRKLVSYGKAEIRRQIGRRYATILKQQNVRIVVNGEACEAFEHCFWDSSRSVERRGLGQIPAVFQFNEIVGNQSRCSVCNDLIPASQQSCPTCGSVSFVTIQERIRGWVGIQRFDDANEFGIDLIRMTN